MGRNYGRYGAAGPRRSRRSKGAGGLLTTGQFFDLLRRRTRRTARAVDHRIEQSCVRELTVLVCDSSGFSRRTHEFGILQFLSVMTQSYDRLIPLVERRGGDCLSHNADNLVAVFPDALSAVRAAVDMHRWLARRNKDVPEGERFNLCMGIHEGVVIRLKDNAFGACVNVASKIGEDLADKDEILVSGKVAERLKGRVKAPYARSTEIGGRTFELHRIVYGRRI